MGLHGVFDDRQTEAGPARISRSVFVHTVKTLEDMRLVAQWDTNAIITNTDQNGGCLAASLQVDSGAGFAAMLQGIVQQIVKRLLDSEGIGLDARQTFRHGHGHRRAAFTNPRIQLLENPLNALRQNDRFESETDLSGLQLG